MLLPTLVPSNLKETNIDASLIGRSSSSSDDLRTIWDITWSCLITIFACTWVAVHPNMPQPFNQRTADLISWYRPRKAILARIKVAVVALLAPEFILAWSIRQWFVARDIERALRAAASTPGAVRGRLAWRAVMEAFPTNVAREQGIFPASEGKVTLDIPVGKDDDVTGKGV